VITDDFHQARSLFLAEAHGLETVGFPSQHVPFKWARKTLLREVASRAWACLDVYVLRTQPKFYGPPVSIPGVS
jgi:SanA protein